jgi:putative effector of murein hydrolase LrgA (UPF0299 family)
MEAGENYLMKSFMFFFIPCYVLLVSTNQGARDEQDM